MTPDDLRVMANDPSVFQRELIIPSGHGPRRFADVMADFQVDRFDAINGSLMSVAKGERPDPQRFWWEATKGASKDSDLAICLLWLLAFSRRPFSCQIGAADRDQANELRKAAKDVLRLNTWLAQRVDIQAWKLTCAATGAEAEIVPADTTGSHGARPDVLILNELGHIQKREFAENLLDNASKVPQGLVVIATNAGFIGTWQEEWRDTAIESDRWSVHIRDTPAPWIDPAEMKEARRRNSSSRFNRLWRGVWSTGEDGAISADDLDACTSLLGPDPAYRDSWFPYVMGIDLGRKWDHSAAVVVGCDSQDEELKMAECRSWAPPRPGQPIDQEEVFEDCSRLVSMFQVSAIAYDPSEGGTMLAQRLAAAAPTGCLQPSLIEMPFSSPNCHLMAQALLEAFSQRYIALYEHRELFADLMRLQITERIGGYVLTAKRDDTGHCDRAIALSIALGCIYKFGADIACGDDDIEEVTPYMCV